MKRSHSPPPLNMKAIRGEEEDDMDSYDEKTPFLRSSGIEIPLSPPSPPSQIPHDTPAERAARRFRRYIMFLILLFIVSVDLPAVLGGTSQTRIMEDIYCKQYYAQHDPAKIGSDGSIEESLCKIEGVQGQLSLLRGWGSFLGHLPGLFLAIPFGMLADKFGRKWFLVMNIIAMEVDAVYSYFICAMPHIFDLRWLWLGAVTKLFGGGSMVATALIFVIVSDVTPTSSMASTFFALGGANMACFVLAPPLAAALMAKDPWIPFTLGLCLSVLSIPIVLIMPETLGVRKPTDPAPAELKTARPTEEEKRGPSPIPPVTPFRRPTAFSRQAKRFLAYIARNTAFLLQDWRILFICSTYPIRMSLSTLDGNLLQYISKRYEGWTMARATYIFSFQAATGMLVLLVLLPLLSKYLLNTCKYTTQRKDVFFVRSGLTLLASGLIVTGFAPSIPFLLLGILIGTLGSGCGASMRALMTSFVKPNEVGRLYTFLGIVETVGLMVAGPVVASLYTWGVKAVDEGQAMILLGMPWLCVGAIVILFAVGFAVVNFEDEKKNVAEEEKGLAAHMAH